MARPKQKYDLAKLFPSIVTIVGLCAGISSVRFALAGKWELAIEFIILAAIIDAVDGRLARVLNATSNFGAHLDSLSDFLNFGFAPIFVIFLWKLEEVPRLGWATVLFFTICCVIRLARFNTDLDDDEKKEWSDKFFTGVPSPAGALMVLAPLILSFSTETYYTSYKGAFTFILNNNFIMVYSIIVSLLMASKIPTYSFKKVLINKDYISLVMVMFALFVIFLFIETWFTILFIGLIYVLSIPISTYHYYRLRNSIQ